MEDAEGLMASAGLGIGDGGGSAARVGSPAIEGRAAGTPKFHRALPGTLAQIRMGPGMHSPR